MSSSIRSTTDSPLGLTKPNLSHASRLLILTTAFLGWFCAGFLLSITSVVLQPATIDLLSRTGQLDHGRYAELSARVKQKPAPGSSQILTDSEQAELQRGNILVGEWVAWLKCGFLFGAALGGLCFGIIGDRFGRTKGMGLAILTYSSMAYVGSWSMRPEVLLVWWVLACMGVGGMWPNGVALVAEAWSSLSRTASAGIIGSAANIGIYCMSSLMIAHPPVARGGQSVSDLFQSLTQPSSWFSFSKVTPVPADWRWAYCFAALPVVLGLFSLFCVPESPLWLANRGQSKASFTNANSKGEIFRAPYLWITLIGIALATIPLIGGWGSADWMV